MLRTPYGLALLLLSAGCGSAASNPFHSGSTAGAETSGGTGGASGAAGSSGAASGVAGSSGLAITSNSAGSGGVSDNGTAGSAGSSGLLLNGTTWSSDTANGWGSGKTLHFPNGSGTPDSEGVTKLAFGTTGMYVSTERDGDNSNVSRLSVLSFDGSVAKNHAHGDA